MNQLCMLRGEASTDSTQRSPRECFDRFVVGLASDADTQVLDDFIARARKQLLEVSVPHLELADIELEAAPISQGAFGAVYKGRWLSGGVPVALKVELHPSSRRRALPTTAPPQEQGLQAGFEAEILFSLSTQHPNVVQ